jgi:hypothetical protein
MGAWSLEAFLDSESVCVDLDKIVCDCIEATGDNHVVLKDHVNPISKKKIGVRVEWPGWFIILMLRDDAGVVSDAIDLSRSKSTPASIKSRLVKCNQSVRVIFGQDDAKQFTNHIIHIAELLKKRSSDRVYDSLQKKFW